MSKPRVTIYVEGGVADYAADPGIDVEIVDYDNLETRLTRGTMTMADPPRDFDENGHPGPQLRAWIDGDYEVPGMARI